MPPRKAQAGPTSAGAASSRGSSSSSGSSGGVARAAPTAADMKLAILASIRESVTVGTAEEAAIEAAEEARLHPRALLHPLAGLWAPAIPAPPPSGGSALPARLGNGSGPQLGFAPVKKKLAKLDAPKQFQPKLAANPCSTISMALLDDVASVKRSLRVLKKERQGDPSPGTSASRKAKSRDPVPATSIQPAAAAVAVPAAAPVVAKPPPVLHSKPPALVPKKPTAAGTTLASANSRKQPPPAALLSSGGLVRDSSKQPTPGTRPLSASKQPTPGTLSASPAAEGLVAASVRTPAALPPAAFSSGGKTVARKRKRAEEAAEEVAAVVADEEKGPPKHVPKVQKQLPVPWWSPGGQGAASLQMCAALPTGDGPPLLADEPGTGAIEVRRSEKFPRAGLGLWALGKPPALEYVMTGRRIRQAVSLKMWEQRAPGFDHLLMVSAVDDSGFRDENGQLRPKRDLGEYVSRCTQQLTYYEHTGSWDIFPPVTYLGLKDTDLNPAAFANDALYGKICGFRNRTNYDKHDAKLNSLVMLPGLSKVHNGQVEFDRMWLYPRRGWRWPTQGMQEVTVGYYWPLLPYQQNAPPPPPSETKKDAEFAKIA